MSGRMKVIMDDGKRWIAAWNFAIMPPGHDTWAVSNESCIVIDWH